MDEFVEDCASIPSGTLKEQIFAFLVSDKRSVNVLSNVLQTDPVHALVSNYEECHGQLSLDRWKYIFQQLGYSKEHFQQLVAADQMMADATDIVGILVGDLDKNNCGANSIPRDSPEWSLPLSDESVFKENIVEDTAKGDDDQDLSMQAAAEQGPSLENDIIPSTVQSFSQGNSSTLGLAPVVENGGNSALAVIEGREENLAASSVQADYKQQSIDKTSTTPSRPTTPEAPRSIHDPVVTGQHRSRQSNAVNEAHPPGNGEQDLEYSNQESGNSFKTPTENDCIQLAENDCIENNSGLYAELQKANESLQLDVSYLVEKLRKKDLVCAGLQNKCNGLQQQLEECRGQCTELQIINEEFKRHLEESAELETESERLIRMTQELCSCREQENNRLEELCICREQENNRLEEHIRQLDQRHDNANRCMEDLRKENQELSEELQLAFGLMRDLQREYRDRNLEKELEQLRLQYEERMAEAARAFNSVETDKVKRLKQKLVREKSKRKTLLEENYQLKALVKELRSKEEGHFPSCGSGEDDEGENPELSTGASSEDEGDEQSGSSNHNQKSDSDSSSEDDRLGDASTDATVS